MTTQNTSLGAPARQSRDSKRAMWSGFLGSAVEFYDFLLYTTAATLVFPQLFFTNLSPEMGISLSFVTLAAGYLARPLGGIIFGHFGDRLGRRAMLMITLVMMGGVSVLIGLLPTYNTIGMAAPVLLVVLRVIQGIAMGGEWAGAALLSMEHAGEKRRGFGASVAVAGGPAGAILSTSILALFTLLPDEQFMAWGWRVPFLLSVALVAIGIYLRLKVSESPEFQALKETKKVSTKFPLMEVFRKHPRVLLLTIIGGIAPLFIQNMLNSFGINYAINTGGHERSSTLWTFTAVTVFHMLAILGSAAFSDRLGRRKVMIIGMMLGAICVWPGFALISSGSAWGLFFGFFLIGPVGQGIMYGPIGAFMAELYSTGSRYTGASLSYQLSSALGGGFAPLISTSLVIAAGGSIIPLNLLVGLICIVSALAVFGSASASRRDPWARIQNEATVIAKAYSK